MDIGQLNGSFGIEGNLEFATGNGGLPVARISNSLCAGELYLHGAHITSYQPVGKADALWMSGESYFEEGKPVRGGVPICWPWFGAHPSNQELPQHGFARISDWTVVKTQQLADGATEICLRLSDSEATRSMWPHRFELLMRVAFGETLDLELKISNTGDAEFESSTALHSYFAVGDIGKVVVKGLAGRTFVDQLDDDALKVQSGSIHFDREIDRVYVGSDDEVVVEEPGRDPVRISKTGSLSSVVWNPWIAKSKRMPDYPDDGYQTMVCIETTNAESDARLIAPHASHVIGQTIHIAGE